MEKRWEIKGVKVGQRRRERRRGENQTGENKDFILGVITNLPNVKCLKIIMIPFQSLGKTLTSVIVRLLTSNQYA